MYDSVWWNILFFNEARLPEIDFVFASNGFQVILKDIKTEFVEKGIGHITSNIERLVAKGKLDKESR